MSKTLIRGLALLELVDREGPIGLSELARRMNMDKAAVSRMVSACEADGWIVRPGRQVALGPRAALLGRDAPAGRAGRAAEPLVHAIAGVTGLHTQALGLVGAGVMVLAAAPGDGGFVPSGLVLRYPLWLTAGSHVVAAQLDEDELLALLPPDPFPSVEEALASFGPPSVLDQFFGSYGLMPTAQRRESPSYPLRTRSDLLTRLEAIRRAGVALDRGDMHPDISCVALSWPRPGLAAGFLSIGLSKDVDSRTADIERVLRAAAGAEASREDIVLAAASEPARVLSH